MIKWMEHFEIKLDSVPPLTKGAGTMNTDQDSAVTHFLAHSIG
jgi:hypothetical protein